MKVRCIQSPPCLHLVPIGFGFGISFVHIKNLSLEQMSYFGRSHFNESNLAFWRLGVAPEPQMMLFATWGWSIHPDRLLIVEAVVRHLLGPQNLTRIVQDPACGEIFCVAGLDRK